MNNAHLCELLVYFAWPPLFAYTLCTYSCAHTHTHTQIHRYIHIVRPKHRSKSKSVTTKQKCQKFLARLGSAQLWNVSQVEVSREEEAGAAEEAAKKENQTDLIPYSGFTPRWYLPCNAYFAPLLHIDILGRSFHLTENPPPLPALPTSIYHS